MELAEVASAVAASWGLDTCDPADVPDWTPDNPSRGQCGVTALVVQDLLGGELLLAEVHVAGERTGWHYWNRLDTDIDLTREQFRPDEVLTEPVVVPYPARPPGRCREEYELLRSRVLERLQT